MKQTKFILLFITIILLSSCAVKMVADYDQNSSDKIVEVSRMINMFYIKLVDHNQQERQYIKFVTDYRQIEVELEALILLNKMRPINEESTQQAENILALWQKYKEAHKEKDTYSDVQIKLHRKRFNRNFAAMALSEKLKTDDE